MNTNYSTAPPRRGQSPSAPNNLKYTFDPAKSVLFDIEVYPGRWCVGFLSHTGKHAVVDGDRQSLAAILDRIAGAGSTLIGYNSTRYDLPILRAILAGKNPYKVSRAIIDYKEGFNPAVKAAMKRWPTICPDHIDLAARTRMAGRFPSLKTVAANFGCKHLQELPFEPDQELTDEEWEEVKHYNRKDLEATRLLLEHFSPELTAIAALSQRYNMDLRSVHQAAIAAKILCAAYRSKYGCDPTKLIPPPSVRYTPPSEVRRPQNPAAAEWYDRLTTEAFPMVLAKGADHPRPVLPEPNEQIIIGGLHLNVGSGGLHSADRPSLHRSDDEYEVYEADVSSFYPSMMAGYGIFPRSLGDCGLEQFREILSERIKIKERAGVQTDPAEAQRLRAMASGLKIVLNSTFGQLGNPYSTLYDPEAFLTVTLSGQLLLIDLVERLVQIGVEVLSANTDGLFFRSKSGAGDWRGVLSDWQEDTGMVLETVPVEALVIEATNNLAVRYPDGRVKRRGTLSGNISWKNVPNSLVVADAVVAALFDGVLPEHTVRSCVDPSRFVSITRRDRDKVGVLINDATGEETPLPRLVRWYKAKDSQLRIEHRWTDLAGKTHKTTPPGATGVQLLMDLPEPGQLLGDIDYAWYAGEGSTPRNRGEGG